LKVLIAAVDEPVALMALESVTGAGLEVSTIGISTLALYRAWAKNAPDINEPALLVHLDEDFTELVLVANGQPVYNRSAPVGIKKLVAEIGSAGPMGFGDSELARLDALEPHRLFLKESGVNPAAAANEPQGAAARSWLLRLLRELRQTVDFARREASAPSPNRVCVTGTGTAIHNICEFLAANTGATVDRWNPWAGFDVADGITGFITPEERLSFAPLAGALLPDVPGAPYPNLIPSSYLEARRVKARKQFLAITGVQVAAILLLAYLLVAQRITHMRDTIAEYKERNQALSKVAADLVAKQQRNQIVRNYIRGQSTPVEILNHISEFEIIPDKVTLTRFEYKKDEYVKVSGHALDIQGVNAMESALRQTGLFTRVSQDQGSNAPIQLPNRGKDGTVLQFSITCELAKPSGRNTRRSGAATVVTN
jgi:Tfp pilus assembly protein PilN